jgi:hypothetical protein
MSSSIFLGAMVGSGSSDGIVVLLWEVLVALSEVVEVVEAVGVNS